MMVQPKSKGDESLLGNTRTGRYVVSESLTEGRCLVRDIEGGHVLPKYAGAGNRRERRALPSIREDRTPPQCLIASIAESQRLRSLR